MPLSYSDGKFFKNFVNPHSKDCYFDSLLTFPKNDSVRGTLSLLRLKNCLLKHKIKLHTADYLLSNKCTSYQTDYYAFNLQKIDLL